MDTIRHYPVEKNVGINFQAYYIRTVVKKSRSFYPLMEI